MAVQITRRRMRSGGACCAALSALALTGGFAGAEVAPVGLAVELGVSAVFVSAWSAIGNYINLVLGKQYKCNQTDVYIPAEPLCQADFHTGTPDFFSAASSGLVGHCGARRPQYAASEEARLADPD